VYAYLSFNKEKNSSLKTENKNFYLGRRGAVWVNKSDRYKIKRLTAKSQYPKNGK